MITCNKANELQQSTLYGVHGAAADTCHSLMLFTSDYNLMKKIAEIFVASNSDGKIKILDD